MRLIDMAIVAGLALAVGWIAAGMKYAAPKTCPAMNGITHTALIVRSDGSYVCQYQASVFGMAKMEVVK